MKKILCALALVTIFNSLAFAQRYGDDGYNYLRNDPLGAGLYLGYKFGVNAAKVPSGIENGLGLANMIDIGAEGYLPFEASSRMGLLFNVAYAQYPYLLNTKGNGDIEGEYTYSYIDVGAQFYVSGFTVGLIVGFPSGGSLKMQGKEFEINSEALATMVSLALGGHFNLYKTDLGRLVLKMQATYAITGQLASDYNGNYNYHPASLMFGLGWIFNLEGERGPR